MNEQPKTAWAELPNAEHIDRIIVELKTDYRRWDTAWEWGESWEAVADEPRQAAWAATNAATRAAAWESVVWEAQNAVSDLISHRAWDVAVDAFIALIAWDDCAHLLDTEPEQVRVLGLMGHQPAILLLPATIALSKSSKKSIAYSA